MMLTRIAPVLLIGALGLGVCPTADAAPASAQASTPAASGRTACHDTRAAYPVLEREQRSPAVATLQCQLNGLGLDAGPVVVDGYYGPQTQAAVTEIENGFEGPRARPGEIDAGFWVLLFARQIDKPFPHVGDHGPNVKNLQRALRAAGCEITVDGDYGDQTRRVVRSYRKNVGGHLAFNLTMGAALS